METLECIHQPKICRSQFTSHIDYCYSCGSVILFCNLTCFPKKEEEEEVVSGPLSYSFCGSMNYTCSKYVVPTPAREWGRALFCGSGRS